MTCLIMKEECTPEELMTTSNNKEIQRAIAEFSEKHGEQTHVTGAYKKGLGQGFLYSLRQVHSPNVEGLCAEYKKHLLKHPMSFTSNPLDDMSGVLILVEQFKKGFEKGQEIGQETHLPDISE